MNEDRKRLWDVGLGIAGPILTVAGILVGVWQFNVGEARKAAYEQAAKLWQQRLDTYTTVAKLAGKIATSTDKADLKTAADDFMRSYWGDMILVEDEPVEKAMVAFHEELTDY